MAGILPKYTCYIFTRRYVYSKLNECTMFYRSITTDFWIGLRLDSDQLPSYVYKYEDGTDASFFAWASWEPILQETHHCVRVSWYFSMTFLTMQCTEPYQFLCDNTGNVSSRGIVISWSKHIYLHFRFQLL